MERLSADIDQGMSWYDSGVGACPWSQSDLLDSHIEVQESVPWLIRPDGRALRDFDAAVRLFEWLPRLRRDEARDPRLWSGLALSQFSDYCRCRWPLAGDTQARVTSVRQHWYVLGEGLASLRRHALSRLWWAIELTKAPWEREPSLRALEVDDIYAYSRVLLGNQDVYQAFIERRFGSDARVLIPALEAIRVQEAAGRPVGVAAKTLGKCINLVMRYRQLGELPLSEQLSLYAAELEAQASPSS